MHELNARSTASSLGPAARCSGLLLVGGSAVSPVLRFATRRTHVRAFAGAAFPLPSLGSSSLRFVLHACVVLVLALCRLPALFLTRAGQRQHQRQRQRRLRRARLRERLGVALPGWGRSGFGFGGLAPVWGCSLRRAPEVTRNLTGGQTAGGLDGGCFSLRRLSPRQNPGEAAPAWRREQPRPQSDKRASAQPRSTHGIPQVLFHPATRFPRLLSG